MREGRREPSLHAARCLDPRPLLHAARRAPPRLAPALCRPRHAALCSTRCGRDSAGRCIAASSCAAPAPSLGGATSICCLHRPRRLARIRAARAGPVCGTRTRLAMGVVIPPPERCHATSRPPSQSIRRDRAQRAGGRTWWIAAACRRWLATEQGRTGARSLSNDNAPLTVDRPASSTRRVQLDVFEDDCGALRWACPVWGSIAMGQRQARGESGV